MGRFMRMVYQQCTHLDQIQDVEPSAEGCEECLQMGDTWVHLRECLVCGHVGCCDSSVSLRTRNDVLFRATLSSDGTASHSVTSAVSA
jgi:hypothetical protein